MVHSFDWLLADFRTQFHLAEVEFYITGIWLIKGSFIALYFDIFRSLSAKIKWGLYFTAVYTLFSWFANCLLPLLYCRPISLVWYDMIRINFLFIKKIHVRPEINISYLMYLWDRAIEGHCTSFRSKLGTTFPMVTNVTTDLLSIHGPDICLSRRQFEINK